MATERTYIEETLPGTTRATLKRRGLMAGAAALVAGLAAKAMAESAPVAAADGDAILIGQASNTGSNLTALTAPVAGPGATFRAINSSSGAALNGVGNSGIGVSGESTTGPGVRGATGGAEDGVRGIATGTGRGVSGFAGSGIGVQGNASGTGKGVEGLSVSGPGVRGSTGAGSSDDGGRFLADKGRGVAGFSNSGIGVYGTALQFGVVGAASAAGGYGIYGLATVAGSTGFAGGSGNANAYAAVFGGRVVIGDGGPGIPGGLIVTGSLGITGTKSAIVPDGSGGHRLMYCVESPESWFEDFGEGTLTGGKAEVKLAADFASTVDTSKLHVFFTAHDGDHALHLVGRTGTGFSVGAVPSTAGAAAGKKASDLAGMFTYRVVAKRKDVEAPRLAKIDLPQVKLTPPSISNINDTVPPGKTP